MIAASDNLQWIADRTGLAFSSAARAIANTIDGKIEGMVAFDMWAPNSVHMHMAFDSPLAARALIRPSLDYAFRQANRGIALGVVRASNSRSLNFAKGIGFKEFARIPNGWTANEDYVCLEMRREDCRWLERT